MSETTGQAGHRGAATAVVNESYSFACMRCGHGWEQSYEIEHHTDADGNDFVLYVADGRVVPSPLSSPSCRNCDGHVVRIMRAGWVSSAQSHLHEHEHRHQRPQRPAMEAASESAPGGEAGAGSPEDHHWHLSDLLHPFHRKAG
ncbi:hypothetical protein [Streptomyces carpinensis]|uniref:C2H2-type domain-containing protein n=1 Tax=Streptomyces carpinensis TaxID=66369 RepID=A0ABV1WH14_9ACTN|nr:hypothetical protein [Streptomyces carpinensis]